MSLKDLFFPPVRVRGMRRAERRRKAREPRYRVLEHVVNRHKRYQQVRA